MNDSNWQKEVDLAKLAIEREKVALESSKLRVEHEKLDMERKKLFGEEYRDVSANLRFYADMRFKQLVYIATLNTAFVVAIIKMLEPKDGAMVKNAYWFSAFVAAAGLALTWLVRAMESRSTAYWSNFRDRASELEALLDFKQYPPRLPKEPKQSERPFEIGSATQAADLIYLIQITMWAAAFFMFLICAVLGTDFNEWGSVAVFILILNLIVLLDRFC